MRVSNRIHLSTEGRGGRVIIARVMGSPRLKWLRIHKYRNVVPGTYLEFGENYNVLLGRNGTGKTTLLELIEMIWAKGFGRIAEEAFHLEYAVEFDEGGFGEGPADVTGDEGFVIEANVENASTETARSESRAPRSGNSAFQYNYQVTVLNRSGRPVLKVEGSPLRATLSSAGGTGAVAVLGPTSWPVVWVAPGQFVSEGLSERAERSDEYDPVRPTWLEWCDIIVLFRHHEGRFDESLGAFQALTSLDYRPGERGLEGAHWALDRGIDQQVGPLPDGSCGFFSHELLRRWHDELAKDPRREPPEFQTSFREIGLAVFLELTGYREVLVKSGTPSRERHRLGERLSFRAPEFQIVLPNADFPAQDLSFGEKRLLAFLWYLSCHPSIVIADELVNGFHHAWIERCVELMQGKQAFLASQNPLLLDCLPLGSAEEVRRCFITCRRLADGRMEWKNLSAEDAADFYQAYERQTRYTHEILQGKGLW